jgi:hypothetical protein
MIMNMRENLGLQRPAHQEFYAEVSSRGLVQVTAGIPGWAPRQFFTLILLVVVECPVFYPLFDIVIAKPHQDKPSACKGVVAAIP